MRKIITYPQIDVNAKIEGRKSDDRFRRVPSGILRLALLSLCFLLLFGGMSKLAQAQEKHFVISSAVIPTKIYYTDPFWLNVTARNTEVQIFRADLYFVAYIDEQYWFNSTTQTVYWTGSCSWSYYKTGLAVGAHTFQIYLYWNDSGTIRFQDQVGPLTTLVVQLYVSNWSPQPQPLTVQKGRTIPSTLTVSFNNGGNDIMYGTTVAVSDSKGLAFSPTTQNIGNLTSGASTTFNFSVTAPSSLSVGSYTVSFLVSYSDFGNGSHSETKSVTINVELLSTSLLLTNPSSAELGETITIWAKLIDSDGNPLAGQSVIFTMGNQYIGTFSTDSSGNASATYKITLPAATYVICATYSGSSNYGPSYTTSNILIKPLTLTITITLADAQIISVNGTTYSTDASGEARIEIDKLGTYTVQIISPYPLGAGTRTVFTKWGDGVTLNPRIIVISENLTLTAAYKTQHYLSIKTDPLGIATISGEGWCDSGASITTGTASATVAGATGTQYVFLEWAIDDVSQPSNPVSIVMNAPHRAVAKYKTQYYLTVRSDYGNPQGERWWDAGSTATFSVTSPVGIGIQQVFTGWSGDSTVTTTTATIVINGPKTVSANWRTDYTQLYMIIAAIAVIGAVTTIALTRRRKS